MLVKLLILRFLNFYLFVIISDYIFRVLIYIKIEQKI